jgi:hypothetical protein
MIVSNDLKPLSGVQNVNGNTLDMAKVAQLVADGVWTSDDLAAHGVKITEPFEVPDGKQRVGEPRYVESKERVSQVYDLEDAPPPPPELTPEQKLNALGLTVAELRGLIEGSL